MKAFLTFLLLLGLATGAQAEIKTQEIEYSGGGVRLKGFLAYDDAVSGKRPGVLVVHEWWGHNEHTRNRARMLAEMGYTALAVDMYGDGKSADHPDKAGELIKAAFADWEASTARFMAARKVLAEHATVDSKHIAAIGFCFGGAVSIRMARGGADLDGVVAFHSALPLEPPMEKGKVKASILVINGAADGFLKPETLAAFMKQMKEANVDLTYMSLAGIKHSYTNPQADAYREKFKLDNLVYDKAADERAWAAMQAFFQRIFSR